MFSLYKFKLFTLPPIYTPPMGIMILKLMAAIESRVLLLDVGNFHLGLFSGFYAQTNEKATPRSFKPRG